MTPDTSAPQPVHRRASTSRVRVGLGCSARCFPACGFLLRLAFVDPDGLCPPDGGTLELSGPLGGKPNFASSSTTRAINNAFCSNSTAISASFAARASACVTARLTHISPRTATKKCKTSQSAGVSNYVPGANSRAASPKRCRPPQPCFAKVLKYFYFPKAPFPFCNCVPGNLPRVLLLLFRNNSGGTAAVFRENSVIDFLTMRKNAVT